MRSDTRSDQLSHIVHELAGLPGGLAVDIVSKTLPHFGPGQPGTGLQVHQRSFGINELPESVSIPSGSDEIMVRLRGTLDTPQAEEPLVNELTSFFADPDLHDSWDVRTRFTNSGDRQPAYELMVYWHVPAALPEPLM